MERKKLLFFKHMQIQNQTLHQFILNNLQIINLNHGGMCSQHKP
jgi:hypothetical protein